jgi:hypothetical protein
VQVEFVMLDPYVRATLAHDGAGRFSARVKVPDTYGVFKWVLDYRRLGYSYIEMTGGWVAVGVDQWRGGSRWVWGGVGGDVNLSVLLWRWGPLGAPAAPATRPACSTCLPACPPACLPACLPAETVPVRPFKHDEYERFILQAYPYYASVASMMAGFLVLGALFLYTK